jgi:hypothetical protein
MIPSGAAWDVCAGAAREPAGSLGARELTVSAHALGVYFPVSNRIPLIGHYLETKRVAHVAEG